MTSYLFPICIMLLGLAFGVVVFLSDRTYYRRLKELNSQCLFCFKPRLPGGLPYCAIHSKIYSPEALKAEFEASIKALMDAMTKNHRDLH